MILLKKTGVLFVGIMSYLDERGLLDKRKQRTDAGVCEAAQSPGIEVGEPAHGAERLVQPR
jgi:hypothetical protein